MESEFVNKKAVIIGGSRGIGASICKQLIKSGCSVAATHLGTEEGIKGAQELRETAVQHGQHFLDGAVDCTDKDKTCSFINDVEKQFGNIDFLVYCAGFTSPVVFDDITVEQWRKVVDVNLNGVFIALHYVLPRMSKQGSGNIVLIGSAAITSGGGGRADYVSSKAGLEGLNLAITREFSPKGIRCNLVHPSLIETDLLRSRYPDPVKREELCERVPLGRLGQPQDVADLVCFLLSDKASYITGQSILVDGGRSYCGR